MSEFAIEKAMKNVEASVNMEWLSGSDFSKELCKKLSRKEITFEEYLKLTVAGVFFDKFI